ncbi:electron transfer flavoprotein subunit beta/FixA family protein [Loigolactobacillus rennini]|uniref:electron transfer flavoprotein subunit beta/FixA family protein n=1 Tax=Loigolactobacillus rennini TaxID=238013 RepID=UPI00070EE9DA|nr:hypothetical protein [Loigolactobacillus rennini]
MNIVVYIKAIIDPDNAQDCLSNKSNKGSVILNPYDKYAIETALQLREKYKGNVTAVSLGTKTETEKVLREALSLGVDSAITALDDKFSEINAYSPSLGYILGNLPIQKADYYIVGREAADDNQAVVGAGIAAALGTDFVDNVDEIKTQDNEQLTLVSRWDQSELSATYTQKPLVISVTDTINTPRLPSFKTKIQARKAEIKEITVKQPKQFEVKQLGNTKLALPELKKKTAVIFNLDEDENAVNELFTKLQQQNIL